MAASANSDPPLFEPGARSKISRYAMTYARRHPGDVLSYLRRVWPEQGERLVENPACLRFLGAFKVLLENGETLKIHKTWIPLPELRHLRGRYLLPGEKASFPCLDPPIPEDGTLGDWEFLPQLGCKTAPDLYFWVSTLSDIKFNSQDKIASPQRVKDLYLLLYETYLQAMDGNEGEKRIASYIRYGFTRGSLLLQSQGWGNPDLSFRYGPEGMYSKKSSMPLPAEWNATPSESNLIARFYKDVLLLEDVTKYSIILEELKLYRTKYPSRARKWVKRYSGNSGEDIPKLYQGLEDLDVRGRDREHMIQEFKKHPYITCSPKPKWGNEWIHHEECVWSHGVNLPNQIDLSQRYPQLKSFFVDRLEIPELTMNVLQKQLLEFADDAPAYETFTLMSYLNTLVQNLDALMDPSEFISKPIFPILSPTGESKRVMRLDPLFKWLGMQKRYLTLQARYAVDWPCEGKLRKIEWDIGQKAEALLRIAAYFRSCRTENDFVRNELLQSLRHAIMIEVEDMFSETNLIGIDTRDSQHSAGEPSNVVKDTYPQLKLTNSEPRRVIAYAAADKKQQELAIAVALPRLLMEWLMTPLNYYDGGRGGRVNIPELGVSLVKSVLNAPPELANDILEVEGIEQPFPIPEDRRGAPENEECLDQVEVCLDQMEVQKAKATHQTRRTPATATPAQTTPVEPPSEQAPVTQVPGATQDGLLYEPVGKTPDAETASRRKILIPRTRKLQPSAGALASSGSPQFTADSTAHEVL
ncbi:hypothetical protein FCIRC_3065 [Fusarium circinatum]|uniref:Uncharacterized protein n=1 Tax=Fusarium circinatum TaxID=48490 RepID=A0A8H5X3K1_FUSCI|nr:hypothetical protein FCIRC_3065 [Fusarium circinatum]